MRTTFTDAYILWVAAIAVSGASHLRAQEPAGTVVIEKGTASFDIGTNVPAVSVHGTSKDLRAKVRLRQAPGELVLERVEAWVFVKTLGTGMALRDEHMRKHVFATDGGQMPDLRFTSGEVKCPAGQGVVLCQVAGKLAVRGIERPFAIELKIREEGNAATFRAAGDGVLKLSDYGIERPSQFGVKTDDEVRLHVEFTGKKEPALAASSGGRR